MDQINPFIDPNMLQTARTVAVKLEAVTIPVSDLDRAKEFYARLGWRLDADFTHGEERVLQFTPPGSPASVIFGTGGTTEPGSVQNSLLVVSDIEAARQELLHRGVEVSQTFHSADNVYTGTDEPYLFGSSRVSGPDPERRSYRSHASFSDPDGNGWLLQEVTERLPGRVEAGTSFASAADLAAALRRAAAAHGGHEERTGEHDADWPDWYAEYMANEQAGRPLPR